MTQQPSPAPASTTRQETARQTETAGDNLIPPGQVTHEHLLYDAESQVEDLQRFLEEKFPLALGLSNRQVPERPVDTAMRLLMGIQATLGTVVARCTEPFCNKSQGHHDAHGWVHY